MVNMSLHAPCGSCPNPVCAACSTSEAAALGEAEFHTMAGSLSTLLDHHHDSHLAHHLPLSASELNLASWTSPGPGPGDAGDLSGETQCLLAS